MKISSLPSHRIAAASRPSILDRLARNSLFRLLSRLQGGTLTIEEDDHIQAFGSRDTDADYEDALSVHISVNNPAFYRMVMMRGSIGAGEAYMMNFWHTTNLTDLVRLICRNMKQLEKMDGGMATLGLLAQRVKHWMSANTLTGSKKNIRAHYDLSNNLFESFLDRRMMYSSAIYPQADSDLETAAAFKLQRVGEKLGLTEQDHVLEIGTGWGGLAIYLAGHFGCKVTTTTISREQHAYTREQIDKYGLQDKITLLEKDYRLLNGQYDKLVSIEMIEAVGQKYLPVYFDKCNSLLKPGGKMLIQAITIPEQRYDYARKNMDFIQRYIFPGGSLPSIEVILQNTGKHTDLQIEELEDIGIDYARTLADWHTRFNAAERQVLDMGFDPLFVRLWQFYLAYCEGGFRERAISTAQIVFRKV